MPNILVAAQSATTSAVPLLAVAADLVARGHRVMMMTGAVHAAAIGAMGAELHELPPLADLDAAPMRHQNAELSAALSRNRFDAIIADREFHGVIPLLLATPAQRPPVLYFTPTPLPPTLRLDVAVLADQFIVATVPSFEYPRGDLPANVRFVGPVHPRRSRAFIRPRRWSDVDGERPVVHVDQSDDDGDLDRLVVPCLEALCDDDVTVVVTTGGGEPDDISVALPANAIVIKHIPYDVLLPKVDVLVTSGGYETVQRALATGVPVIVAAADEPEVAARVAWSGAGLDLGTGRPSAALLRSAIHRIRDDGRYLHRARQLEADFARRDGIAEIAALVADVIACRHRTSHHRNSDSGS